MVNSLRYSGRVVKHKAYGVIGVLFCSLSVVLSPDIAFANPAGGTVAAGVVVINSSGKKVDVNQFSNRAIIDWRSFDIAPDEHTQFHQPSSSSVILNRVNSNSRSEIMGQLSANGNVIIVNQNGVMFGAGSRVDVNGLIATTADIDNSNFMTQSPMVFNKPGASDAKIINNGVITAKEAGLVGLVAPQVENNGVITATLGKVQLASADRMTLDLYGDGLVALAVSDTVLKQSVINKGNISADGGRVNITAAAGNRVVRGLINVSGEVRAKTVRKQGGTIIIGAAGSNRSSKSGSSKTVISGTLDASGAAIGEQGGKISIYADNIELTTSAVLNASGATGSVSSYAGKNISDVRADAAGGNITIGGNYQGKGNGQFAIQVQVDAGAKIIARSVDRGDGGRVIVWSDGATLFRGDIDVRGGDKSGNGGFAEVSGKEWLGYQGNVLATARHGEMGNLLLDPGDIIICTFGGANCASDPMPQTLSPSPTNFNSGTNNGISYVDIGNSTKAGSLVKQLQTSNVTIATGAAGTGNGDISLLDPLSWATNYTLTLTAHRDVNINKAINFTGASNNLVINAGRNITTSSTGSISWTGSGSTTLNAGTSSAGLITTNGTFSWSGAGSVNLQAYNNNGSGLIVNNTITNSGAGAGSINLYSRAANLTVNSNLTTGLNGSLYMNSAYGASYTSASNGINLNAVAWVGKGGLTLISGSGAGVNNITATADGSSLRYGAAAPASGNIRFLAGAASITDATTINSLNIQIAGGINFTTPVRVNGGITLYSFNTQSYNIMQSNGSINMQGPIGYAYDITLNQPISATGNVTIYSPRHINVNGSITSGAANGVYLYAGGGQRAFTSNNVNEAGLINLNAPIITGNSLGILNGSALAGTATAAWDGTNFTYNGQNITFQAGNISTPGSLNNLLLAGSNIQLTAPVIASGALELRSLGALSLPDIETGILSNDSSRMWLESGYGAGTGAITFNGTVKPGNNFLMWNDINNTALAGRPDATFDAVNGLRIGGTSIAFKSGGGLGLSDPARSVTRLDLRGANDITFSDQSYVGSRGVVLIAYRHLTLGSSIDTTGTLTVSAANGTWTNPGLLTFSAGNYNIGAGALNMYSGHDGSGNYLTDVVINSDHMMIGGARFNFMGGTHNIADAGTLNSLYLMGFRDITANNAVKTSSHLYLLGSRNVTMQNVTSTGGHIYLYAAKNNAANVGLLTLNGNISAYNSVLMTSGTDGSGGRNSYVFDNIKLATYGTGAFGNSSFGDLQIGGFNDMTFSNGIKASYGANLTAYRNLTINGNVSSGRYLYLYAAGSNINSQGQLAINGNISLGYYSSGYPFALYSGLDAGGNRADFSSLITLTDGSNRVASINFQGFRNVTMNTTNSLVNTQTSNTINITGDLLLNQNWINSNANTITANSINQSAGSIFAANAGTFNLTLNHNMAGGAATSTLNLYRTTLANTITVGSGGSLTINLPQNVTIANTSLGGNTGNMTVNSRGDITLSGNISKTTGNTYLNADANLNSIFTDALAPTLGYSVGATGNDGKGAVRFAAGFSKVTTTTGNAKYYSAGLYADGVTVANAVIGNGTGAGNYGFSTASGQMAMTGFNNMSFTNAAGLTMTGAGSLELRPNGSISITALMNPASTTATLLISPMDNARNFGVGDGTVASGLQISTASLNNIGNNWRRLDFGNSGNSAIMEVAARSWRTDTRFYSGAGTINFIGNQTSQAGTATSFIISGNSQVNGNIDLSAAGSGYGAIQFDDFTHSVAGNLLSNGGNITVNGDITLTGAAGSYNMSAAAGTFSVGATGSIDAGNHGLVVQSNSIELLGDLNGSDSLTLKPFTAGRSIGVASATGLWNLNAGEVSHIKSGFSSVLVDSNAGNSTMNIGTSDWLAPVTFRTVNANIILEGSLSSSSSLSGSTLVMATDANFINSGGSIDAGANGRWLVYSNNYADTTGEDLLANDFNRYGCSYSGGCVSGVSIASSGNGFIYQSRPTLTVTVGDQNYSYGDAVGTPTQYTLSGFVNTTDSATNTMGGTASFATTYTQGMNAGTSYTVVDNGSTLYSELGYQLTYTGANTVVSKRALSIRAGDQVRTYGFGGNSAALGTTGFSIVSGNLYGADNISNVTLATNATHSGAGYYNASNGTAWSLSPSAAVFSSGLGSNYNIAYLNATGGLTVNRADVNVSGISAINRAYDSTSAVGISGVAYANAFAGDNLVITGTAAGTMADRHIGIGKAVAVSGLSAGGSDGDNYNIIMPANLTVNITPKNIALSGLSVQSRSYDATRAADLLGTAAIASYMGDDVSVAGSYTGEFLSPNAGTHNVLVTGLYLDGADAANYNMLTQPGLSGVISKRGVRVIAEDATRTTGVENPDFNVRFDGLAGNQTRYNAGISGKAGFYTDADINSPMGSYYITPSAGTLYSSNYDFLAFVDGVLTVTPRRILPSSVEQITQVPSLHMSNSLGYSDAPLAPAGNIYGAVIPVGSKPDASYENDGTYLIRSREYDSDVAILTYDNMELIKVSDKLARFIGTETKIR